MCGIAVVNRVEIERYAAQHLAGNDRIVAEYVCGWENLHCLKEEICTARAFSDGLLHDEYLPEGQDEEEMYIPQACLFACDVAVGFGIELLETLVKVVVIKQVEYLTTVEFDRVDEIFRIVQTWQCGRRVVLVRI